MIENDAFWTAPSLDEINGLAAEKGCPPAQASVELFARRRGMIELARGDPYRFGYEPDIWLVARAVLGMEVIPEVRRHMLAERTGWDEARVWARWRDGVCSRLGLPHYLTELMISGANRAAKTELAAKMSHEVGMEPGRKVWVGSQQWANSLDTVQDRMHRYIPKVWPLNYRSPQVYQVVDEEWLYGQFVREPRGEQV